MPKIIPIESAKSPQNKPESWKQQLSQAITDPDQLLKILKLDTEKHDHFSVSKQDFSLKAPLAYIHKMKPGDPYDPLLLQIMTQSQEFVTSEGYSEDPVGDLDANQTPGLLHKYHGRVLLITTAACAVHCRYCFRRHFPYQELQAGRNQWHEAINYIQQDNSIQEVILSGGDPLVLSDERLDSLITQLEDIPHLSRLRIHSRLPVVLPERITEKLITRLKQSRFNVCLVIHANHANEITQVEINALRKLQQAGIHLLNQAVLLKGINHRLEDQIALSESLYNAGVLPYYLHLLDPVQGAAHFHQDLEAALSLVKLMQAKLPGFLVPKLVREIAGQMSKTPANEL